MERGFDARANLLQERKEAEVLSMFGAAFLLPKMTEFESEYTLTIKSGGNAMFITRL